MNWIKSLTLIFLASFIMLASSCSSDDDLNKEAPTEEYVTKAKDILNGDIVLSTKATMSGVDKTHLANGCPTKFNFTWSEFIMILYYAIKIKKESDIILVIAI